MSNCVGTVRYESQEECEAKTERLRIVVAELLAGIESHWCASCDAYHIRFHAKCPVWLGMDLALHTLEVRNKSKL